MVGGNQWSRSADGLAWTAGTPFVAGETLVKAAGSGNTLVLLGYDTTASKPSIHASTNNGVTWAAPVLKTNAKLKGIAKASSMYVTVGDSGAILTSLNGVAWADRSLKDKKAELRAVASSPKLIVAAGGLFASISGVVYTSTNGTSWMLQNLPVAAHPLNDIVWTGALFVAVGDGGTVVTSPDGVNWTLRNAWTNEDLRGVAWDGKQLLAVGANGAEVTSEDVPQVSFTNKTLTVLEGSGSVSVTVTLSSAASAALTVPIAVSGTAMAGTDYSGVPPSVTFAKGQTTIPFVVTLKDDAVQEPDKTLILTLGDSAGTRLGVMPTNTIVIKDDDDVPTVAFSESSARVREDAQAVTVNVVLSRPANAALTVPISIATGAGMAVSGSDFTGVPASMTFNAGDQVKTITLQIVDDSEVEDSENVVLSFGTLSGVTVGDIASYTLTIDDNDPVSMPGRSWDLRLPASSANGLGAAAFVGSRMVVVGEGGFSMTSDDGGVSWKSHSMGTEQSFSQVIYANNQLLAVGGGSTVALSPDGVTWSRYVLPNIGLSAPNVSDVAWTGINYVAVGAYFDDDVSNVRPAILTSPDGIRWTPRFAAPLGVALSSVAWSGGKIVAVGNGVILSSTDGITWEDRTSGMPGMNFYSVMWAGTIGSASANDRFVAFDRSKTAYVSADGIGWTRRAAGGGVSWGVWNGAKVVAVGDVIAISNNSTATQWTARASGLATTLWNVAYSPLGGYVAVGDDHALLTSVNGVTWVRCNAGISQAQDLVLNGVTWSGSQYVAVGGDPDQRRPALVVSSLDGKTWTNRPVTAKGELRGLAWSGSVFVAVGRSGLILTSSDGITWSPRTSPGGKLNLHGVIWVGNQFIAVGGHVTGEFDSTGFGGCVVLTSPNGVTWTRQTTPTVPPLHSIAWSGSKFVAVGQAAILTSLDGINWTKQSNPLPAPETLLGVTWGGGRFVAVSSERHAMHSQDGVSWLIATGMSTTANFDKSVTGVCWTGAEYQATSVYGEVLISSDADTWASRQSVTNQTLNGIISNGALEIAVGDAATIITSGGGTPPTPEVNFVLSGSTISESAGAAKIAVTMFPAAASDVTVPLVFSGSADAADYTALPSTLTFKAGETSVVISIPIKNDFVQEGNETIIVTLGTPTGANLGVRNQHTVTIVDDDMTLTVSGPMHQLLPVGAELAMRVTVTGNAPITYQWRKNNQPIRGATASYYYVQAVSLAHAGAYTCVVNDASGTVTSGIAQVGVYEVASRSNLIPAAQDAKGCTVTQSASSNCALDWYKGGSLVAASDSFVFNSSHSALTIKNPSVNGGTYTCYVRLMGVSSSLVPAVAADQWGVGVIASAPSFAETNLPPGSIGVYYSQSMAMLTAGVVSWSAKGLPAGLSIHPLSGMISGYPTAVAKDQMVTVTATNGAGASSTHSRITINGLPPALVGTTVGLVDRDPSNQNLGARVTWTMTAQGTFTGSYTVGTTRTPFNGQAVAHGNTRADCETIFVIGDRRFTLINQFVPNSSSGGTLEIEDLFGAAIASLTHRNWPAHLQPASYAGRYNFALRLTAPSAGDTSVPQGHGFGNATISPTGAVVIAGRAGDGAIIASSGYVDIEGKAVCYSPLYGSGGSLMALPKISTGDTSILDLASATWGRLADKNPAGARTYAAGWSPVTVKLEGSKYSAPAPGAVALGLSYAVGGANATLAFNEGGLNDTPPNPGVDVNLKALGTIDLIAKLKNPRATSLVVSPKTGEFTGTFTMVDVMPNHLPLTRVVKHQGQITRILSENPSNQGFGYFLLPQLPTGDITPMPLPASTQILSGNVVLKPKS